MWAGILQGMIDLGLGLFNGIPRIGRGEPVHGSWPVRTSRDIRDHGIPLGLGEGGGMIPAVADEGAVAE
jgi:hypothetical protein